jgi:hypothetical protein
MGGNDSIKGVEKLAAPFGVRCLGNSHFFGADAKSHNSSSVLNGSRKNLKFGVMDEFGDVAQLETKAEVCLSEP